MKQRYIDFTKLPYKKGAFKMFEVFLLAVYRLTVALYQPTSCAPKHPQPHHLVRVRKRPEKWSETSEKLPKNP